MSRIPAPEAPPTPEPSPAAPVAPVASRSRASIRTWSASLGFTVATMVTGLVATPILVKALGEERIGLFRALTEGLSYLTMLGQGISVSLVPAVAAAMAVGDRGRLNRTMAAALRVYLAATGVALAIALLVLPVLPRLLKVGPGLAAETRWAWVVTLVSVLMMSVAPMRIVIDVAHRGYLANLLMIAQAVLAAALNVAFALWTGLGLVGLVLGTVIGGLVYQLGVLVVVRGLMPGLLADAVGVRPGPEEWRSVRSTSGPTLLALLSERIGVLSDSLVLTAVLGPAAAAVLFLTQRLASLGQTTLGSIGQAIWPGLAELHNRNDHALLNLRLVEAARIQAILAVVGLAPIVAYNHHFVALWVGSELDGGPAVVIGAALNALLLSFCSMLGMVLVSTGEIRRLARVSLVTATINLGVSVAASMAFGPVGPVLGTLAATICVPLWYLPHLLRMKFGTSRLKLARAIGVPLALGVAAAGLLSIWARAHTPAGWLGLIGEMGLASSALLAFSYRTLLTPEDRELWNRRLVAPLLARILPGRGDGDGADASGP